jgi:CRISPR-associated protein Csm3
MPRQIERVPAGAEFGLNMVLNIFDSDNNEEELKKALERAMKLLEDDYLGGNGSRGYGQVAFREVKWTERTIQDYVS